ncbi:hypothetical protein [Streptomyces sp. CC219B]|uniref:hypothetical protein n=1 Tax=Streptomyces sp. CC219B TaxID=3044574 RepID=UPI0032C0FF31
MRAQVEEHLAELVGREGRRGQRGRGRVGAQGVEEQGEGAAPGVRGDRASRQAAELIDGGTRVTVLAPDRAARRAMGRNLADDGRRPAAARAGYAQARAAAPAVAEVWQG